MWLFQNVFVIHEFNKLVCGDDMTVKAGMLVSAILILSELACIELCLLSTPCIEKVLRVFGKIKTVGKINEDDSNVAAVRGAERYDHIPKSRGPFIKGNVFTLIVAACVDDNYVGIISGTYFSEGSR